MKRSLVTEHYLFITAPAPRPAAPLPKRAAAPHPLFGMRPACAPADPFGSAVRAQMERMEQDAARRRRLLLGTPR